MLKIKTYDKNTLFLRESMATVNLPDGEQIELSMNCDGRSILFHTPTAIHCITLGALMDEVLEQREAGKLEVKERAGDDDNDTEDSGSDPDGSD